MPNWVTNVVKVTKNCKEFKENFFVSGKEGELVFDFNTIIPRPSDLLIMSGSDSYQYCDNQQVKDLFIENYHDTDTQEEFVDRILLNLIKKNIPYYDTEELKERELERVTNQAKGYYNLQKYGFEDWYDWSRENWGTKWNACDTLILVDYEGELYFSFNTAWCTPENVYRKLASMGYEFTVAYADEDLGYNVGLIKTEDNNIVFRNLEEEENHVFFTFAIQNKSLYKDEIIDNLANCEIEYTEKQIDEVIEELKEFVPSY